jgi:hypothetical protein
MVDTTTHLPSPEPPGHEQHWPEATASRADAGARAARESLSWHYDHDGMLVFSARLAPEGGQRVVSVIEDIQHLAAEHDHGRDVEDAAPPGCTAVEALARMADLALAHADKPRD